MLVRNGVVWQKGELLLTYCMSDLHGMYDKYLAMLEKINLRAEDTLYILGDLSDRGPDGLKIILDADRRENVICLRGNHDDLALELLDGSEKENADAMTNRIRKKYELFAFWFSVGGETTLREFMKRSERDRQHVIWFWRGMPYCEQIEAGGRRFLLAHTVPARERIIGVEEIDLKDFLEPIPEYGSVYFKDRLIVTGHTPTYFIDERYEGRIWKGNDHIAIDCGASFGGTLGCICLDTMEEFYV